MVPHEPGVAKALICPVSAGVCFADPWMWRPATSPWFLALIGLASRWRPAPDLDLDPEPLIEAIVAAAAREERWLLHPCINPLTLGGSEARLQRDFQLAVWIAAHCDGSVGTIRVPEALWAWSPDGGRATAPGTYELKELGGLVTSDAWPWPIAFDVWGRTVASRQEQTWYDAAPDSAGDEAVLRSETIRFLRACTTAARDLGPVHEWMTAMTQVAIPMRRIGGRFSKSSSSRQLPGLVFLTLHDEAQILEALVHETAHNYLFLAEMTGPLIDPGHDALYPSPLRLDRRPLLGVLLAYHALAYIGAYYRDALRGGVIVRQRCEEELIEVGSKLADAARTLRENKRFLTENGRRFMEKTSQVADYGQDLS